MPVEQLQRILHTACRVARVFGADDATDGALLERFASRKDQLAFAELVRRHGPMVFGVCRRVVGAHHEAEDAFQATFLVLVRKAHSLFGSTQVAAWLHGVAYRTALEARGRMTRHQAREEPLAEFPDRNDDASMRNEIKTIIDREVSRLPDKYRLPVILCELEGRSRSEAAVALKLSEGTLSSRLATARRTLARRLSKYGFTLPATGLAVLLEQQTMAAAVPERLVASVVESAAKTLAGEAVATVPAAVLSLVESVSQAVSAAKAKMVLVFATLIGVVATTAYVGASSQKTLTVAALPANKTGSVESPAIAGEPTPSDSPKPNPIAEPKANEAADLRTRVKALENDISRIRKEMLRQCAIDEKKADEALRVANVELQDALRRRDFEAHRKAFQAVGKANSDKLQVFRVRSEILMRIRLDDPHFEQQVGLIVNGGPANAFGKMIGGAKDRGGIMIERVVRDSPASDAGLQAFDILLEMDGKPVPGNLPDFRRMLAEFEPQTAVDVTLLRKGRKQTIKGLVMPDGGE